MFSPPSFDPVFQPHVTLPFIVSGRDCSGDSAWCLQAVARWLTRRVWGFLGCYLDRVDVASLSAQHGAGTVCCCSRGPG